MLKSTYFIIALVAAIAGLYVFLRIFIKTYLKFRGKMIVPCPETGENAAVEVDAKHAAISTALRVRDLRLQQCSRWPERQDCGQEGLAQIELSPENCLIRKSLCDWYEGRSCVYCKKPFERINWHDHKPALRSPEGNLLEWSDLQSEQLPRFLEDHLPVCWNCFIAEDFRHHHPDLVVDRPHRQKHHA